jgi:hypothetical protein
VDEEPEIVVDLPKAKGGATPQLSSEIPQTVKEWTAKYGEPLVRGVLAAIGRTHLGHNPVNTEIEQTMDRWFAAYGPARVKQELREVLPD